MDLKSRILIWNFHQDLIYLQSKGWIMWEFILAQVDIAFYVSFKQHLWSKAPGNDKWGAYRESELVIKQGTNYQVPQ